MKTSQQGFTLIELLLTISLLVISLGITGDILITVIRSFTKSQVITDIEQTANFVNQKLENELRNAKDITSPTLGNSAPAVTFLTQDDVAITYIVDETNNLITRKVGSNSAEPLSSSTSIGGVDISCLTSCFQLISSNPKVLYINIIFAQAGNPLSNIFKGNISIENTIVLRSTY